MIDPVDRVMLLLLAAQVELTVLMASRVVPTVDGNTHSRIRQIAVQCERALDEVIDRNPQRG